MNVGVGGLAAAKGVEAVRMRGSNLWRKVRFRLDGQVFERRLVSTAVTELDELSAESPVGAALMTARVGDEMTVRAPGGNVIVKVLAVL